ncbi:hypothetical protein [Sulfuracidifex metallicus]|uniref:hypothetical protein n=1 Tax=Sulfuracidifex metallicus TaxID=47303 RepID=UPI000AC1AAB2|nr:hypothetical protein [Sulfuracidifex metallicus]
MVGFFTSHGSPTILTEDSPWKEFWRRMGEKFSDVDSVVVISLISLLIHVSTWRYKIS